MNSEIIPVLEVVLPIGRQRAPPPYVVPKLLSLATVRLPHPATPWAANHLDHLFCIARTPPSASLPHRVRSYRLRVEIFTSQKQQAMPYDILGANIPFAIGEVQTSKRGQKFAPITVDGQAKLFQLTDFDHALYAPFGCGVYQERGDETRLNLDLQLAEGSDLLGLLEGYDRFFEEQLKGTPRSQYHPMVTRDENNQYPPKFRIKVNTTGTAAAKLWNLEQKMLGNARDVETRGSHIVPVVVFTKAWMMKGQHGVTAELRHAIMTAGATDDAPF